MTEMSKQTECHCLTVLCLSQFSGSLWGKLSTSPSHCRISWDGGFVLCLTLIYGGVLLLKFLRQAEDTVKNRLDY